MEVPETSKSPCPEAKTPAVKNIVLFYRHNIPAIHAHGCAIVEQHRADASRYVLAGASTVDVACLTEAVPIPRVAVFSPVQAFCHLFPNNGTGHNLPISISDLAVAEVQDVEAYENHGGPGQAAKAKLVGLDVRLVCHSKISQFMTFGQWAAQLPQSACSDIVDEYVTRAWDMTDLVTLLLPQMSLECLERAVSWHNRVYYPNWPWIRRRPQ